MFICSVMFSPYVFPVTPQTFNFSSVIFAAVVRLLFLSRGARARL